MRYRSLGLPSVRSGPTPCTRIFVPVRTPAGNFECAVVCAYLIDFGISEATDIVGNPLGCVRYYNYGSVACVDRLGPVACYERRFLTVGGSSIGTGDVTLRLTGYGSDLPVADHR